MSDTGLSNGAVELVRRRYDFFNTCDEAPRAFDHSISDDFTLEDLRSGGANFGHVDASTWGSFICSHWDVGEGSPRFSVPEVIAVRGERCAAMVCVVDYDSGLQNRFIICVCLDPELRAEQRSLALDPHAVEAAVAELDRLHAAIDD